MQTILKNTTRIWVPVFVALMFFGNILSAQYVVNGSATVLGPSNFRLTPALNSQSGSVWFQNKLSLNSDFTITANVYLGTNNGGADGIAFVLQPVCSGIGASGGGLGYQGISPSVAVEYDTWYNSGPGFNDPTSGVDHIGLQKNGSTDHSSTNKLAGPYLLNYDIENGVPYLTEIEWVVSTQTLTVNFNGTQVITYTGNIVANIFGGNDKVFWGFTAGTGAANNDQQVQILSADFSEEIPYSIVQPTCPNLSNGSINLNLTGGLPPFTYLWSTGATTQNLTGIAAGNYLVTVYDRNGCQSKYTIPVTAIPDETDPTITCPTSFSVNNALGACGANVAYTASATDECLLSSLVCSPLPGSFFAVGPTTVTCVALDGSGNDASCAFTVTVEDNEAPVITCNEDIEVNNDPGVCGAAVSFTTLVSDNCGASVECDAASGDFFPVGTTTVTCTATDVAGNEASCDFDITVVDNEAPTALCQDITVSPTSEGNYPIDANAVNNGSTDNCSIASISVNPSEIPCFHEATVQEVILTVTDVAGNSHQCTANVTLLGDDDCDGVGNFCDLCNGGNDQIDNNNDGLPDCAFFTGEDDLYEEWVCGQNDGKVLMCHFPGGNPGNHNTLCVSPNAVQAHLDHGDYVGPCDNASCDGARSASRNNATETYADVHVYPNPASDQLFLLIHGLENKEGRILMYESTGKLVKVINVAEFTGEIIDINLSGFSQGVYFVAVETEGVAIERQRFVISR